jgi:archaellum component FlaC
MVQMMNPEVKAAREGDTKGRSIADRAKQAIKDIQEETEKRMKDLMARGESYGKESLHSIQERIAPAVKLSGNLLSRAKENAEWLQERVEEAVSKALGKLNIPTQAELDQLMQTVQELGKKLEELAERTQEEVQPEVAELRKGVEKLSKSLGQIDQRVRKLADAKPAKPARKGPKE